MAKLSITEAWNEATAYMAREAQLLFPIAFLLVALPGAILQEVMPQTAGPEAAPEVGPWFWLIIPVMVITLYGYLVLCWLSVRRSRAANEGFSAAASRLLPTVGAVLLIALAFILIALPIFAIVGAGAMLGGSTGAVSGAAALMVLVFLMVVIVIGTRLMLFYPVAATERVGPIGILKRSWSLTRGHFWKLLGFLVLFLILAVVVVVAVSAVVGLIIYAVAGQPEPGSFASFLVLLLGAIINTVFALLFAALVSRIYAQLSGAGVESVFD